MSLDARILFVSLVFALLGRCYLDLTGISSLCDARIDNKIFRFSDECSGSALQKIANHDDLLSVYEYVRACAREGRTLTKVFPFP